MSESGHGSRTSFDGSVSSGTFRYGDIVHGASPELEQEGVKRAACPVRKEYGSALEVAMAGAHDDTIGRSVHLIAKGFGQRHLHARKRDRRTSPRRRASAETAGSLAGPKSSAS